MSDCDNCIHYEWDWSDDKIICHKGHTEHKSLIKECEDFEHWNSLSDYEKGDE